MRDSTLVETLFFSEAITCSLLVVIQSYTLYKALTGNRYKAVLIIEGMLLISNIGYLLEGVALLMEDKKRADKTVDDFWSNVAAIGEAIGDMSSSLAYWQLAIYYLKIARNTPRIIAGHFDQVESFKTIFWVGIVLNTIFPLMEAVGYMI